MDGHPVANSNPPHSGSSKANRLHQLRQDGTKASRAPPAPTSNPKPQESDYRTMPVCVEDAESLAELHAECWLDEGIVVLDETLTKQELIDLATARLGHILLIDTEVRRHELVIDNKTGQALAYARWTLPESCAKRWDLRRIPYIEPWERREYKEQHDKTSLPFDTPPELEAPRIATAEADPEYDNVRLSARQRAARRSKQDPKRHAGGNPVRELEEMHMPDRAYEHYIKLDYFRILPGLGQGYEVVMQKIVQSCILRANSIHLPIYCAITGKKTYDTFKALGFNKVVANTLAYGTQGYVVSKLPSPEQDKASAHRNIYRD